MHECSTEKQSSTNQVLHDLQMAADVHTRIKLYHVPKLNFFVPGVGDMTENRLN